MRVLFKRATFADAFGRASSIINDKHPRAVCQNVKLIVPRDGEAALMATDLEVGIRHTLEDLTIFEPGEVLIPANRTQAILETSQDEQIELISSDDSITVAGDDSNYELPIGEPSEFPEPPEFLVDDYHTIIAEDLRKLIRRTIFTAETETGRYAIAGILFEFGVNSIKAVGTDGRRIAIAESRTTVSAAENSSKGILSLKFLKLIEKTLDDDGDQVHIAIQDRSKAVVRTRNAILSGLLVEGRFPKYDMIIPKCSTFSIPFEAGKLRVAIEKAAVIASKESNSIDFTFESGMLVLSAYVADMGKSSVRFPIKYDGQPLSVKFAHTYLISMLKALDAKTEVTLSIVDSSGPAGLEVNDGYKYIVMPIVIENKIETPSVTRENGKSRKARVTETKEARP